MLFNDFTSLKRKAKMLTYCTGGLPDMSVYICYIRSVLVSPVDDFSGNPVILQLPSVDGILWQQGSTVNKFRNGARPANLSQTDSGRESTLHPSKFSGNIIISCKVS